MTKYDELIARYERERAALDARMQAELNRLQALCNHDKTQWTPYGQGSELGYTACLECGEVRKADVKNPAADLKVKISLDPVKSGAILGPMPHQEKQLP